MPILFPSASGTGMQNIVKVSSAEILALATAPVVLIPAPAENQLVLVTAIIIELVFGTVPYVCSGTLPITYEASGLSPAMFAPTQEPLLNSNVNYLSIVRAQGNSTDTSSSIAGSAIILAASVAPTSGDGSLVITSFYNLVNLS